MLSKLFVVRATLLTVVFGIMFVSATTSLDASTG